MWRCGTSSFIFTSFLPTLVSSTSDDCVLYSQCWQLLLAAQTIFRFPGSTFKADVAGTAPTFEQKSNGLVFSSYSCVEQLTRPVLAYFRSQRLPW